MVNVYLESYNFLQGGGRLFVGGPCKIDIKLFKMDIIRKAHARN